MSTLIRATHLYAFRSSEWAVLHGTTTLLVNGGDRDCYLVEFSDGACDFWPVSDEAHGYEFQDSPCPP